MSNIPRSADYVRRKRDEEAARTAEELKRHLSEEHHQRSGLHAVPPDPIESVKQANGRIDALRWRLAEEHHALLERVSNLEEEVRRLRRDFFYRGGTRGIWPEPPDDDLDPTVN